MHFISFILGDQTPSTVTFFYSLPNSSVAEQINEWVHKVNQTPPVSEVDKHWPFAFGVWEKVKGNGPKRERSANDCTLQRNAELNHINVVALVTYSPAGFAVPTEDGAITEENKDRQTGQQDRIIDAKKIFKRVVFNGKIVVVHAKEDFVVAHSIQDGDW